MVNVAHVYFDLAFIFLVMLSRHFREDSAFRKKELKWHDWMFHFALEAWDVVNTVNVAVSLRDTGVNHAHGVISGGELLSEEIDANEGADVDFLLFTAHVVPADFFALFSVVTLALFLISHRFFWTSLSRLTRACQITDLLTDGPMLWVTIALEVWTGSTLRSLGLFVNAFLLSFSFFITPMKAEFAGRRGHDAAAGGDDDDDDDGDDADAGGAGGGAGHVPPPVPAVTPADSGSSSEEGEPPALAPAVCPLGVEACRDGANCRRRGGYHDMLYWHPPAIGAKVDFSKRVRATEIQAARP